MKCHSFLLFVLIIMAGMKDVAAQNAVFKPGEIWRDSNGDTINAHGGGIIYSKNKYYWFGEKRNRQDNREDYERGSQL